MSPPSPAPHTPRPPPLACYQPPSPVAAGAWQVGNSPLEDGLEPERQLEALVNAPDDFLAALLAAVKAGDDLPEAPPAAQILDRFWVQLEQERRPPLQDCWLVKEFMPLAKTKWQQLCEGGEEFEGDDTG